MPTPVPSRSIVFLCDERRRSRYFNALADHESQIVWIDEPAGIVAWCIENSPIAILVDLATNLHVDAATMRRVFEMGINAPILRTNLRPDGTVVTLSVETAWNGSLDEALGGLHSGGPPSNRGTFRRRRLRVAFQCRVLFRGDGESTFRRANTLDVCGAGCFLVAYDPLPVGTPVEIEFVDATAPTSRSHGRVAWIRPWEKSGALPGLGIELDPEGMRPVMEMVLSHLHAEAWPRSAGQ